MVLGIAAFGAFVAGNYIYGVLTAGTVVGVVGIVEARKSRVNMERMERKAEARRREETKWKRPHSITRQSLEDVRKFVKWFQEHIGSATHKVQGVEGWLTKSCYLPAMGLPFSYEAVVLVLNYNQGAYSLTISAQREAQIHTFWETVPN